MLIDETYFKGTIAIAGLIGGNSPVVEDTLTTDFIPVFEKQYLIKALGYSFYKAFMAGLEEETPAQKWIDLRDGKDFTVNDKLYNWNGFTNDDKISAIAYYVYAEFQTDNATLTTGTGEVKNNQQNADNVTASNKIWDAWVRMKKLNDSLYWFLENNKDTYTEYDSALIECFGSRNSFDL